MDRMTFALLMLMALSCNNRRTVQLPEIQNADVVAVFDHSPAYIFYDTLQPNGVVLQRNSLISTTNWLVNVDKRLTLEQAIPKIDFIQTKKRNAKMHRNEAAKNYYTCHDTAIKNLGFLEFTDIYYHAEPVADYVKSQNLKSYLTIDFYSDSILFENQKIKLDTLKVPDTLKLFPRFDKTLNFQQYIDFKVMINKLDTLKIHLDNDEFLF